MARPPPIPNITVLGLHLTLLLTWCCQIHVISARNAGPSLRFQRSIQKGYLVENDVSEQYNSVFISPVDEKTKTQSLFDPKANYVVYKDFGAFSCYLEKIVDQRKILPESKEEGEGDLQAPRTLYMSPRKLTKMQIWSLAGMNIYNFCRGYPMYILQVDKPEYIHAASDNDIATDETPDPNSIYVKDRRRNRRSPSRKYRGQTQSQYLSFGQSDKDGKAEAESTVEGTRAVVSGSGIGQAQSQSGSDGDCPACPEYNGNGGAQRAPGSGGVFGVPPGATYDGRPGRGQPDQHGRRPTGPGGVGTFPDRLSGGRDPSFVGGIQPRPGQGPYGYDQTKPPYDPRQPEKYGVQPGTSDGGTGKSRFPGPLPDGRQDTQGPYGGGQTGHGPYAGRPTGQGPQGSGKPVQGPYGGPAEQGPYGGGQTGQDSHGGGPTGSGPLGERQTEQGPQRGRQTGQGPYGGPDFVQGPSGVGQTGQGPQRGGQTGQGPYGGPDFVQGPSAVGQNGQVLYGGGPTGQGPHGPSSKVPYDGRQPTQDHRGGSQIDQGPFRGGPTGQGPYDGQRPHDGWQPGQRPYDRGQTGTGPYGGEQTGKGPYGGDKSALGPHGGRQTDHSVYGGDKSGLGPHVGKEPGQGTYGGDQSGLGIHGGTHTGQGTYGGDQSGVGPHRGTQTGQGTYGGDQSVLGPHGGRQTGLGTYGGDQSGLGPHGGRQTDQGAYGGDQSGLGVNGRRPTGQGVYGGDQSSSGVHGGRQTGQGTYGDDQSGLGPHGGRQTGQGTYGGDQSGSGPHGGERPGHTTFGQGDVSYPTQITDDYKNYPPGTVEPNGHGQNGHGKYGYQNGKVLTGGPNTFTVSGTFSGSGQIHTGPVELVPGSTQGTDSISHGQLTHRPGYGVDTYGHGGSGQNQYRPGRPEQGPYGPRQTTGQSGSGYPGAGIPGRDQYGTVQRPSGLGPYGEGPTTGPSQRAPGSNGQDTYKPGQTSTGPTGPQHPGAGTSYGTDQTEQGERLPGPYDTRQTGPTHPGTTQGWPDQYGPEHTRPGTGPPGQVHGGQKQPTHGIQPQIDQYGNIIPQPGAGGGGPSGQHPQGGGRYPYDAGSSGTGHHQVPPVGGEQYGTGVQGGRHFGAGQDSYGTDQNQYGTGPSGQRPYGTGQNGQGPYGTRQNGQGSYTDQGGRQTGQDRYGSGQGGLDHRQTGQNGYDQYGVRKTGHDLYEGGQTRGQGPYPDGQAGPSQYGTGPSGGGTYGSEGGASRQPTHLPYQTDGRGVAAGNQGSHGGGTGGRNGYGSGADLAGGKQDDGSDSQAQSSVQQSENGTLSSATASGTHGGGTAQSQVSGTYTGAGSFSAQAGTSDGQRAAQTQVSGGKHGGSSSAQGRGGLGQSQSQVQLNSETGATSSDAQSSGSNQGTSTQVQAGGKGGMADAQATGLGSTSSQAQIGFQPYQDSRKGDHDKQLLPFIGGGSSSAQSGSYSGQSQSQLSGNFKYGISYTGAAQAGSGTKESITKARNQPRPPALVGFAHNATIDDFTGFKPADPKAPPATKLTPEETLLGSATRHSSSTGPLPTNDSTVRNTDDRTRKTEEPKQYDTEAETEVPVGVGHDDDPVGDEDYDYDEEYDSSHLPDISSQLARSESKKTVTIDQVGPRQTQSIGLGSVEDLDVHVIQQDSRTQLRDGMILNPGQAVPGSPGYKIPAGFRGRVTSVANTNDAVAIGGPGTHSQAQSVKLVPGGGNVKYIHPTSNRDNQVSLRSFTPPHRRNSYSSPNSLQVRHGKSFNNPDSFVTVTKSVTGDFNGKQPTAGSSGKKFTHTYYTKSSTCGYFTFSCNIVYGTNGRTKICRPKQPTNPDGTPMQC